MATEVPAAGLDSSLAEVSREARSGAAAMLSGTDTATSTEPGGAPADASATPAAAEPPAAPVSDVPSAPVDPSTLTDAARAFLGRFGGDVNKALEQALSYDSRLAALSRSGVNVHPDQAQPAETPMETPAPPVYAPEQIQQAIEQRVAQFLNTDPTVKQLDAQFGHNEDRLALIGQELATTTKALNDKQVEAGLDYVQQDALRSDDVAAAIARLDQKRLALETEKDLLEGRNERFKARWLSIRDNETSRWTARAQQALQAQQVQVQHEQWVGQAATALETAWDPAMSQAMTKHNIPADEKADFNTDCLNAAYAHLEKGMLVEDAAGFLDKQAERYAATMKRHHSQEAAKYGALAHQRANLSASPGSVPAATPQETDQPTSLDDLYRQTRRELLADARGR